MADQKIKGSILKSRLEFVRKEIGEDGLEKLMDSLPEDDQKILGRLVAVAWVDFEIGKRLDDAIDGLLRAGRTNPRRPPRGLPGIAIVRKAPRSSVDLAGAMTYPAHPGRGDHRLPRMSS